MGNYYEQVLSEEQMAAYLDGMLTPEESNMVEELINSSPELVEIQDMIDSVDNTYFYETDEEIPIECLADDFSLPDVGYEYHNDISSYDLGDSADTDSYNEDYAYQDNSDDIEYHDEDSDTIHEESFIDDGSDDISF